MVATFMKDGHFARHLNRMRKLYQKKIKQLSASLALYAPTVIVSGEQAGMHIVLTVQTTLTEKELVTRAQEAGIRVTGMESYDVHKKDNPHPKIVLGFGGLSEKEIHSGITELMSCWEIH